MKIKRIKLPDFINAFFTVLTPNTIYVNKSKGNIEHLIAHEITHRNQYLRDGLIKYLLIKVICRLFGWLIGNPYEDEAYAVQDITELNIILGENND